jgi:hypothetical protein
MTLMITRVRLHVEFTLREECLIKYGCSWYQCFSLNLSLLLELIVRRMCVAYALSVTRNSHDNRFVTQGCPCAEPTRHEPVHVVDAVALCQGVKRSECGALHPRPHLCHDNFTFTFWGFPVPCAQFRG